MDNTWERYHLKAERTKERRRLFRARAQRNSQEGNTCVSGERERLLVLCAWSYAEVVFLDSHINLQESPAGFGETQEDALEELEREIGKASTKGGE